MQFLNGKKTYLVALATAALAFAQVWATRSRVGSARWGWGRSAPASRTRSGTSGNHAVGVNKNSWSDRTARTIRPPPSKYDERHLGRGTSKSSKVDG